MLLLNPPLLEEALLEEKETEEEAHLAVAAFMTKQLLKRRSF
jgi:hypothetical protein